MLSGAVRQRPHRATTRHLQAAYPFQSQGAISSRGCFIGVEANGGGAFTYCPWTYEAEHAGVLSNPNLLALGNQNAGKSTTAKAYVHRQVGVFGRRALITDVKREYPPLADALGGAVIALHPDNHTGVRLNPLSPWASRTDRLMILYAVAEVAVGHPLGSIDKALARLALEQAEADSPTGEATLPDIVRLLFSPTSEMCTAQAVSPERYAADARELANGLDELVRGPLRGMFDAPTSPQIRWGAPVVVLDISDTGGRSGMGVMMLCATAWQRALVLEEKRRGYARPTIHVTDEAWMALALAREAEAAQERTKLSRDHNVQSLYLIHKLADLKTAGDEGSRVRQIAENLVADCATRVVFAQPLSEAQTLREIVGLTETEIRIVTSPRAMRTGQALWKLGDRSFLVQTLLSPDELALVQTREAMIRTAPGRAAGGLR
jgi:type IV secretory pathway VirB4 component